MEVLVAQDVNVVVLPKQCLVLGPIVVRFVNWQLMDGLTLITHVNQCTSNINSLLVAKSLYCFYLVGVPTIPHWNHVGCPRAKSGQ